MEDKPIHKPLLKRCRLNLESGEGGVGSAQPAEVFLQRRGSFVKIERYKLFSQGGLFQAQLLQVLTASRL